MDMDMDVDMDMDMNMKANNNNARGGSSYGSLQPQLDHETKKVMHAERMRSPRDPDGTQPSTLGVAKTVGAVSVIGALVARRWHLVHVIVGDDAGRGGVLRAGKGTLNFTGI